MWFECFSIQFLLYYTCDIFQEKKFDVGIAFVKIVATDRVRQKRPFAVSCLLLRLVDFHKTPPGGY